MKYYSMVQKSKEKNQKLIINNQNCAILIYIVWHFVMTHSLWKIKLKEIKKNSLIKNQPRFSISWNK